MFVLNGFVVEVMNDTGNQKKYWDMLYGVLDKIIARIIRDCIHWSICMII